MKALWLALLLILPSALAQASDLLELRIEAPDRWFDAQSVAKPTVDLKDGSLHVELKNISHRPLFLHQTMCMVRLMSKLSFNFKKDDGSVDTIECGYHPQQTCEGNSCTAARSCSETGSSGSIVKPGDSYIFDVTAGTCNWKSADSSAEPILGSIQASFDPSEIVFVMQKQTPIPVHFAHPIVSSWKQIEIDGADRDRPEHCIDCYGQQVPKP